MTTKSSLVLLFIAFLVHTNIVASTKTNEKTYQLWYDKPAPELPIVSLDSLNKENVVKYTPVDPAWENWSLPIGNGYLGANIFGRTVTERVQITENSLATRSLYKMAGLTNFGELYIDFNHDNPQHYTRSLNLNDAMSTVKYEQNGVKYEREYFASYPDKVLVIKLKSNVKGKLSFSLRPEVPYKKPYGAASNFSGKTGKVVAQNDLITLSGSIEFLGLLFEGQFKVKTMGGTMTAINDANNDNGKIVVSNADSAVILVAVGTNYKLQSSIFTEKDYSKKLIGNPHPHQKVSSIMEQASAKTYTDLLANHQKDYGNLFNRVSFDLGAKEPTIPTDQLLKNYKTGLEDPYLEELYFRYGRYLLICSSRQGTLPPNLQGIWSQYEVAPFTGGYWHNINIQMNYWPVFNTNLTELFQSFVDYNEAYREAAAQVGTNYIKAYNPKALSSVKGENGWSIGTAASAYCIGAPGAHSGPGTGALTTKMFWDYYEFTGDKKVLKEVCYPAIFGMAQFLSKVVVEKDGYLLTNPSYSPEQVSNKDNKHYKTVGCSFDQQMIYENHVDAIKAAKLIGDKNPALATFEKQLPKLDPFQIGWSGQIKEYREEKYYGELVKEYKHRHISHLLALHPGTLINSTTQAWFDAARVTMTERGDSATGWAIAVRQNLWARLKDGDRAHQLLQIQLKNYTLNNLWDTHPPFQIDGNFGGTAGVAEMLIQSHEGFIELLPALPTKWSTGSFNGLLARGNFEVSANWENNQAVRFSIKSNIGEVCRLKYFNLEKAIVKDSRGNIVPLVSTSSDRIAFNTTKGEVYTLSNIPNYKKVTSVTDLKLTKNSKGTVSVVWKASPDAAFYRVYSNAGNSPNYTLLKSKVIKTTFEGKIPELINRKFAIIRVTAVDKSGRESVGTLLNVEYK